MPDPYNNRPTQNRYNPNSQPPRQYQNGQVPQRRPSGPATDYRQPQNNPQNRQRQNAGNLQYAANRPNYSYNRTTYQKGRRHRRPTPFIVIMIVFVIILMIVIFTSKSFRRFLDSMAPEETVSDTVETNPPETEEITTVPVTETEPVESETVAPPEDDEFLICIDPGHGFGDIGSTTDYLNGSCERDINISVSLKIFDLLDDAGYNVILTHNGEEFPISPDDDGDKLFYIDERVSYANYKKVDLYVSVHCDTFPDNEDVYGTRIYYCTEYKHSENAEKLTNLVKTSVNEIFPKAKEAKTYGKDINSAFYVTAYTDAPSCLIELGFISNPDEAKRLLDDEWQSSMALAISNAISAYINQNVETDS